MKQRDPNLVAIREFTDLVAATVRSPRQRERLARAAGVPLTIANFAALRTIDRHQPIAISELAKRAGVDQSTMSRQLRPLEEHGLVSRGADDTDRRVAWLTTTEAGRALLDRMEDLVLNDFEVALGDWPDEDRVQLARLLERFRRNLLNAQVDESGWSVSPSGDGRRAPR